MQKNQLLPTLLFPCGGKDGGYFCGIFPEDWIPGVELHVRGPRGNGFHLPPLARRVAIVVMDESYLNRLLPVAELAIQNGAEVALFANFIPSQFSPEIEVLPLSDLEQVMVWADFAATCLRLDQITGFRSMLGVDIAKTRHIIVEVQLDVPMVCDENSGCGLCAVRTTQGIKMACKDGPVFSLVDLVEEEDQHE